MIAPRELHCRHCKQTTLQDFACLNAWDTCTLSTWTCRFCKQDTVHPTKLTDTERTFINDRAKRERARCRQ